MNAAADAGIRAGWRHFPHGADTGIEGSGPTPAAAFEQAAVALTALVAEPGSVHPDSPVSVICNAEDMEVLLVDWLNTLIYEMAVRHMLFSRFQVRIREGHLEAQAWGEKVDPDRHQPVVEPKGATYTELKVMQVEKGWIARCVVDV